LRAILLVSACSLTKAVGLKHGDPSTPRFRSRASSFFQAIATRIAAWAERRQAESEAPLPVDDMDEEGVAFAEKFRYTIATSYLLAPSLSISKYEHGETNEKTICIPDRVYHLRLPDAKYRVQTRIAGQLPVGHISAALLFIGWAVCVKVPVALMLLTLIFIDVCTLILPVSEMLQWPPQHLSFSVSTSPETKDGNSFASSQAVLRADEQAYLRAGLLRGAKDLIDAAQSMDQALNDALSAVQEVELVSRRFPLSSPLPPISRIEASWSFDEQGQRHGMFPQRMTSMRKTIADALEEMCFHCRAVYERLETWSEEEEAERVRELMMLRQHSLPMDWDAVSSPMPLSPRPLSLAAWASPSRAMHTPERGRMPRYSYGFLTPGSSPIPSRKSAGDETIYTSYERARHDRLSLVSLRSHFEAMHVERQTILYHLLSLHMDTRRAKQRSGVTVEARVYWDDEIIQGVLKRMTTHFRLCAKQVREHLQDEMSIRVTDKHPGPDIVDLSKQLLKMGQLLRTLQCKMKVCSEDGPMVVPSLHGNVTPSAAFEGPKAATAMFESMKEELNALSTEWEAGMCLLEAPSPPSVPDTPLPYEPLPVPPLSPPHAMTPSDDGEEETVFQSGTLHRELLKEALLASSSPTNLPPPGSEEVFECEARASTPHTPSTLSRAERIARKKQEREVRRAGGEDVQPLAVVSELKSVLHRRTHSVPVHRVGLPHA